MNEREKRITSLLLLVGADTSKATVETIDELISFIPTKWLKHFTDYVLKHYDKYKKPIVNITTASQEYRKKLDMALIKRGEKRLESAEETKKFLLEYFKGQEIANCVTGLYKDFVTIAMNEQGDFINKFADKKLDSLEANDFIFWCFKNQTRIGDVRLIETNTVRENIMLLTTKEDKEPKQIEDTTINPKVLEMMSGIVKRV